MFRVDVLLTPRSSMLATMSLTEPWRLANELLGTGRSDGAPSGLGPAISWNYWSWTGEPVTMSNGLQIPVAGPIADLVVGDALVIVASEEVDAAVSAELVGWLRGIGNHPVLIAGVDAGPNIMASARLLDGQTATMHFEAVPAFREQHRLVRISPGRFQIDERRATSAGSAATLDFSLALIARFVDPGLAARTAGRMLHEPMFERSGRAGVSPLWLDDRVRLAMDVIAGAGAEPGVISRAADASGLSDRHLHRLFMAELGVSPAQFAIDARMQRARTMLTETQLSVTTIALAVGYGATSEFSRAFRRHTGSTPTETRRQSRRRRSADC